MPKAYRMFVAMPALPALKSAPSDHRVSPPTEWPSHTRCQRLVALRPHGLRLVPASCEGASPDSRWFVALDRDVLCPLAHGVAVIPGLHAQQHIHGHVKGLFDP